MSIGMDKIEHPRSPATTVLLTSDARTEPDSSMSTPLEHVVVQKGAAARRPRERRASSAVLDPSAPRQSLYLHGQDTMVQFQGLYVVHGPTESKHVRYTMDVAVAELQLQGRCIQRFRSFFLLRKRLLEVLKTCRGRLVLRKNSMLTGSHDDPAPGSAGAELIELLARPRCLQCPECEAAYDQLVAVKFPRRTLLPPSLQDIRARAQMLETFLEHCVRLATTVSACQRTKRLFMTAVGKFLGVDLLRACLSTQKEGTNMSEIHPVVSTDTPKGEEQLDEAAKSDEIRKDVVDLLISPEVVEKEHSGGDDYEGDRHSEPNFSFISNLAKDDNPHAVMGRSKSHC